MEVCCLTMFEVYVKLKKRAVTFEHARENLENLYALFEYLSVETPPAAQVGGWAMTADGAPGT